MWYLTIALKLALIGRLLRDGLITRYPAFAVFMLVNTCRSLLLLFLGGSVTGAHYRTLWQASLPIVLVLEAAAVLEAIILLIRRNFPGFGVIALSVYAPITLASAFVVWLTSDWGHASWQYVSSTAIQVVRWETGILALVTLGTLLFFTQSGLWEMSPNSRIHASLFAACLGFEALAMAVHEATGAKSPIGTFLGYTAWIGFCAGWTLMMRRTGETTPERTVPATPGPIMEPVERLKQIFASIR